jgi:hypothetical protein
MSLTDLYEEGLAVDELIEKIAAQMAVDRPRLRWWHWVSRLDYSRDGEQYVRWCGMIIAIEGRRKEVFVLRGDEWVLVEPLVHRGVKYGVRVEWEHNASQAGAR